MAPEVDTTTANTPIEQSPTAVEAKYMNYLWLACSALRYAKRKTGSNLMVTLAVLGILVVTCGDIVA